MKRLRLVILFVAIGSVAYVFFPNKSLAQSAQLSEADVKNSVVTWVDRATISVKVGSETITFFDKDISDNTFEYIKQGSYPCDAKITLFNDTTHGLASDPVKLDMDIQPVGQANSPCKNIGSAGSSIERPVISKENFEISYYYADSTTIVRADKNNNWVFKKSDKFPELFLRQSEAGKKCQDTIIVSGSNMKLYELDARKTDNNKSAPPEIHTDPECHVLNTGGSGYNSSSGARDPFIFSERLGITNKDSANGGGTGANPAGDARPSCETTEGNPLSWGLCPLINGAAATADWVLEQFIVPFLDNVPISLDRSGGNAGVFEAWSSFRILANVMLVGVLLFIVIAESTGGGE